MSGVRRKTSSSHLLGSMGGFTRTNSTLPTPAAPPPQSYHYQHAPLTSSSAYANSDAQSISGSTLVDSSAASIRSSAPTMSGSTGGRANAGAGGAPGTGMAVSGPESLSALVEKRTACWWYLRQAHDGNESWFHTITLTRSAISDHLDTTLGTLKVQQRSRNLFMLGLSLSALFEMASPSDLLKTLVKLLDEWEAWSEGGGGKGMKNLFRGQKPNRKAGLGEFAGTFQDSSESYLVVAHLPFQPDYFQTVISFCEIARQLYGRLGLMLIPDKPAASATSHRTTSMNQTSSPRSASIASINNVAMWESPRLGPSATMGGGRGSSTASQVGAAGLGHAGNSVKVSAWGPGISELIMRADGKLKKVMVMLTRELEMVARHAVENELALLMPGIGKQNLSMDREVAA